MYQWEIATPAPAPSTHPFVQLSKSNDNNVVDSQTFGETACHPERSEGSGSPDAEILRFAQDDSQDHSQVRSREVFSPNIWWTRAIKPRAKLLSQSRFSGISEGQHNLKIFDVPTN